MEHFLIYLFGESGNTLQNIYQRLIVKNDDNNSEKNPMYDLYFHKYQLPNIYTSINAIFIDEMIYNITNIYKQCQIDENKIKDHVFEQYTDPSSKTYMSKKKINERIKAVIKAINNGEEHYKNMQLYDLFNQYGDIYHKCLCIKDLLEDAYYIRDHRNDEDEEAEEQHDKMLMEIDSIGNDDIVSKSSLSTNGNSNGNGNPPSM